MTEQGQAACAAESLKAEPLVTTRNAWWACSVSPGGHHFDWNWGPLILKNMSMKRQKIFKSILQCFYIIFSTLHPNTRNGCLKGFI